MFHKDEPEAGHCPLLCQTKYSMGCLGIPANQLFHIRQARPCLKYHADGSALEMPNQTKPKREADSLDKSPVKFTYRGKEYIFCWGGAAGEGMNVTWEGREGRSVL